MFDGLEAASSPSSRSLASPSRIPRGTPRSFAHHDLHRLSLADEQLPKDFGLDEEDFAARPPRKSSLGDAMLVARAGSAVEADTRSDMLMHDSQPPNSRFFDPASRQRSQSETAPAKLLKGKGKVRGTRHQPSPTPIISRQAEPDAEQLSSSLPSSTWSPASHLTHEHKTSLTPFSNGFYTPPRKRPVGTHERNASLPTPPQSPLSRGFAFAQPASPIDLLTPPSSGRSKPAPRYWRATSYETRESSPNTSDGESPTAHRVRRGSVSNGTPRRSRQRSVSANARETGSRAPTPPGALSVGAVVDGVYRELGVINVPLRDGATIVLRGAGGLAIESKVSHTAGETKCEIGVKAGTSSPPFRPVQDRASTPTRSPLLLTEHQTPRQRTISSDSPSPEPKTPVQLREMLPEPIVSSPTFGRGSSQSLHETHTKAASPANRFSAAFEQAVKPPTPSFSFGALAARRLGQGAQGLRLAVKSVWSDTSDMDEGNDTPDAVTPFNETATSDVFTS